MKVRQAPRRARSKPEFIAITGICLKEADETSYWLEMLVRAEIVAEPKLKSIEYVGVPALYRGKPNQFIYPDLMMKIQVTESVLPEFLTLAISDKRARNYMRNLAVGAAGSMPKINHATLRSLPVPLCSLPEQQEIVRLLDGQFEVIEQNEREIDAALKRSEALRQSILKKAFTGHLVPQDPADEPASALLERIRAERQAKLARKAKGSDGSA